MFRVGAEVAPPAALVSLSPLIPRLDAGRTLTVPKDSRRDYICLKAVDPATGGACDVQISHSRMQAVGKRRLGQASECAYIVPSILQGPTAIFEGLREDADEDKQGYGWRCYCGIPENAYRVDGTKCRPYRDQVYLVFVNDEHVAYNWRWEKADQRNPRFPQNYDTRFKRHLL